MARKARYPAATLCTVDLDLLSRKGEYLRAVAEAALDGLLNGAALHAPDEAVRRVQQVKGSARSPPNKSWSRREHPAALPRHEPLLEREPHDRHCQSAVRSHAALAGQIAVDNESLGGGGLRRGRCDPARTAAEHLQHDWANWRSRARPARRTSHWPTQA
jgi:hypothetical protein